MTLLRLFILWSAGTLAAAAVDSHSNLFRVRSLMDANGKVHQLGLASGSKAVVFVFLGNECPISQRYVPELNRIATQSNTNSVEFYGVISGRSTTRAKAAAFAKEYAITFPVLIDDNLALARWLRPTHVPEAYVTKPDGDLMYHGRIDDGYEAVGRQRTVVAHRELRDAISAVLEGKTPKRVFAQPVGCYFEELSSR